MQHVWVSSVGRTTGPLTPSPDAKYSSSKLERKGQPKKNRSKTNANRQRQNSIKLVLIVLVEMEAGSRTKTTYRQGLP